MENVWEKLKSLKGRSWIETKDILNKIGKDIPQVEEIVVSYNVNSETLPPEEREIYGIYPKSEPFYLKRCKLCSHLLKPCVLNHHYDVHHKRNINSSKKTSFVSPGKKKHGKKSNKSTSEDDSESIISSEAPSPAVDLQESQSNDSNTGTIRDDSIIDVISVDEIPSEESKPPTPGPQDFYEEFAVPYSEEVQVILSAENGESSKPPYSNSKPVLKLKINSSKDSNPKQSSSTTSLLEAHLLSNTKYSTSSSSSGNCSSDVKYRGLNYKFGATTFKNDGPGSDQSARKSEEAVAADPNEWKASMSVGSPKLKTETKISIPISVVPQTVKIIGSLKKPISQVAAAQSPVSSLEESCGAGLPASPYQIEADADPAIEVPALNGVKEKSTKSKRNKRSKGKNRSAKTTEFDPDKHCGVLLDENRHCLRSLTCKTHAIALRRAVEGRCKEFDKLLADHRASKEAGKEHERYPSVALSEPSHSIPISSSEKASGTPAQSLAASSDAEIIKIRVPNVSSSASEVSPAASNFENSPDRSPSPKVEPEMASPKIPHSLKTAVTGPKPVNVISKVSQNASSMNGEVKPQIYDSDIKISFVCSDMLYKVGGLLYTDRSRQAIRKCMEPLVSPAKPKAKRGGPLSRQRITDFLRQVKNYGAAPAQRLHLFEEESPYSGKPSAKKAAALRDQLAQKAHDEVERMKQVLSSSTRALNSLAADEHEMRRFRACAKRKGERPAAGAKKVKQEALVADENYDLNSLLCMGAKGEPAAQFEAAYVKEERRADYEYLESGAGAAYVDTAQLLQTYKDLEHEIRNTVGSGMQELYPAPQPYVYVEAQPYKCADGDYKAQMENHIEETISKNYSLLEEYCKNIPTDELFLEPKPEAQYYESGAAKKGEPNGAVYRAEVAGGEGLFDTQLLSTYLSSISEGHGGAEMGYAGRQFEVAPEQAMSKEQVYEEILTLNKQFQDSAAVNIEKPPTPNPVVYTEVENDEVLKWLF